MTEEKKAVYDLLFNPDKTREEVFSIWGFRSLPEYSLTDTTKLDLKLYYAICKLKTDEDDFIVWSKNNTYQKELMFSKKAGLTEFGHKWIEKLHE